MTHFSADEGIFWRDEGAGKRHYPRLDENLSADVCVVGAGFTGLTTAYLLQQSGLSVVVLDGHEIGLGESSRSTAHLTAVLDPKYYQLEEKFGVEKTALIAQGHVTAIALIQQIIADEKIDCACYPATGYMLAATEEERQHLEREYAATLQVSIPAEIVPEVNLGPFSWHTGALQFTKQAIFHPTRYMQQMAKIIADRGGVIRTGNPVWEVHGGNDPYVVVEDGYRVEAKSVVIATHTPINDVLSIHTKQAAYRTYAIAMRVPKDVYKPFLMWDMKDPYHYVRTVSGETYDMLVVGGEDHKTGQADDAEERYQAIEDWGRALFPRSGPVMYKWSGQTINSIDGIAFIGRNPGEENIYIATGFSGTGMSYGTIAAALIRDLITGVPNALEDVYAPSRKMFNAIGDYLRENSNAVGYMLADWAAPAEVASEEDINPGQGAILRRGLHKVAACRDSDGKLHLCGATCTHIACLVQWNSSERSWDCPCCGSRFAPDGQVLHGPAVRPLPKIDGPAAASVADDVVATLQGVPPPDPAIPT